MNPLLKGGQGRSADDHAECVTHWGFCLIVVIVYTLAHAILY